MNAKYGVRYFEAPSCVELTEKVNEFFDENCLISIRDVAYLSEMRANRLNPAQALVFFVCIITFKVYNEPDAC